jgi:DNA-binding NarL/FixJ family response regulator
VRDSSVKALVADAHSLSAIGIMHLLKQIPIIAEVSLARDGPSICAALAGCKALSFLTMDGALLGASGLDGIRTLRQHYPAMKIVMISDDSAVSTIFDSIAAGAHGYVPKDLPAPEMTAAFQAVLNGHIYVPDHVANPPPDGQTYPAKPSDGVMARLTARQEEVIEQLYLGRSNKEIANALKISESTVKVHLAAVFRVLGVHNRGSAIAALTRQHTSVGQAEWRSPNDTTP